MKWPAYEPQCCYFCICTLNRLRHQQCVAVLNIMWMHKTDSHVFLGNFVVTLKLLFYWVMSVSCTYLWLISVTCWHKTMERCRMFPCLAQTFLLVISLRSSGAVYAGSCCSRQWQWDSYPCDFIALTAGLILEGYNYSCSSSYASLYSCVFTRHLQSVLAVSVVSVACHCGVICGVINKRFEPSGNKYVQVGLYAKPYSRSAV